jgi:hypothetical protein
MRRDWLLAAACLAAILLLAFAPAVFGGKTLMLASWDASSITAAGAYDSRAPSTVRLQRTSDPGASAWQTEAWLKLISNQFWSEAGLPLWNPYNAYGTPLAADALSQPFFPLTILTSLHVTPWTYNIFILGRLLLGGMLMFFYARQFLTRLPALFAGIAFMLSGYFMIYLNIAHLSVEVLTPGVFLAFELLLRRNSWKAVAGVAASILIGMTGGMPESLFLMMAFGSFYFVWRLLLTPKFRSQAVALSIKFVASVILGLALSGFLLLPFLEFLRLAHDVHQPSNLGGLQSGLLHNNDYRLTIQYLLPLIFGPILNSMLSQFSGSSGLGAYWGIIPFFFAVIALLALFSRGRQPAWTSNRAITIFFAASLALMILKRFGSGLINWIGRLPLAEMVLFPKYQEPLMALCVAMLGGIGFAAVVQRRVTARQSLAAAVIVLVSMLAVAGSYLPAVRSLATRVVSYHSLTVSTSLFYYASIMCGVALLFVIGALVWSTHRASDTVRPWLLRGAVVLLTLELLLNFPIPSFYLFGSLPPKEADPYKGAPYIDFLQAQKKDHHRVFAREGLLFPNWSSVFGISDARGLDAMYYKRYRGFIRNFLLPPGLESRRHGDLADRFTGWDLSYEFDTDLEKRYLALSSIKYLVSDSDYGRSQKVLNAILDQHRHENIPGFWADVFHVGDQTTSSLRGLFQHPPSTRVAYKVTIDPARPIFEAIAVMKKEAFLRSDGAGFRLELKDGDRIETLFQAQLDPRSIAADRDGRPIRLDLSKYAGREVELLFSTAPGPKGDSDGDLAGWANLRFASYNEPAESSAFKKIYDKDFRIFEVPWVLPRAAIYQAIEILPDGDVLARLKAPDFNPNERAVVSRESLPADTSTAASLAAAGSTPLARATIVRHRSQQVQIEADSAAPALLVLSDTDFPGWRAYLNGQPAPIVTANYLFRGVFIPAGKSTVEFRYEPRSFRIGAAMSLAAFMILAGLMFAERRRRGARNAPCAA